MGACPSPLTHAAAEKTEEQREKTGNLMRGGGGGGDGILPSREDKQVPSMFGKP